MRSLRALAGKEWRELLASRSFWLLLAIVGPLTGHAFITAVESYAEMSGAARAPAALPQGLTPLDGIFVPAFGAYDLAITLLFPFVAIRLVASEKESGALKLMLQSPAGLPAMMAAKGVVLAAGWALAWLPGLTAVALWRIYGGHAYAPELLNLLAGHALRFVLSAGVAVAAAAVAPGAASAAIATLAFTVGTWALDFVAMARGGVLQQIAAYTPAAALRGFEQGQLRAGAATVTLLVGLAGFAFAAVWISPESHRRRLRNTAIVAAAAGAAVWSAALMRPSWDLSENRRNSFPRADEQALRRIGAPLRVTVNLAAEDPRLTDLERNILAKLARVLPSVRVEYAARTRSGLFEGDRYGEIWYEFIGHKAMNRSTTEPIVLDTLYSLAGVAAPNRGGEPDYPGYPLNARPTGATFLYYLLWPAAVIGAGWLHFRYRS